MSDKVIITIARQYCSGGHEVGEVLAKKLGYAFYDKELLARAAKESGYTETLFEEADETPSNSLLYSVVMSTYPLATFGYGDESILSNDKLFGIQTKIIREIAKEEPCIIVGRCADHILRDEPKVVRVFIRADMELRKERLKEINSDIKEKNLEQTLRKIDKKRGNYYAYYTGNQWNELDNYDLIVNTSKTGINGAVEQIVQFIKNLEG